MLLDALMHRLGEGLTTTKSPRPRSEEEEIGADEEEGGEVARKAPDFEVLAKACRGKVRRLIKRMGGQLELAAAPDRARRGIVQLAAVLGVIRTLRSVEQRPEWKRMRHELVDRQDEWSLHQSAALAVAWGTEALAPRAIEEAGGECFAELSMVVGLLAWLAAGQAVIRSRGPGATRSLIFGKHLRASGWDSLRRSHGTATNAGAVRRGPVRVQHEASRFGAGDKVSSLL